MISGDFNGDGRLDLGVSYRGFYDSQIPGAVYLYWGGNGLDTLPDKIVKREGPFGENHEYFSHQLENIGDVNKDGFDDIYAASWCCTDSFQFVYFGGPNIDDIPDLRFRGRRSRVRAAGDLNKDGVSDFIASDPTNILAVGRVEIHLGGLGIDTSADHVFNVNQYSLLQYEFGMDVTGIGDYNGDGIDDFAFSSIGAAEHRGMIYIYKGWSTGTSVNDNTDILPRVYLFQNYPNPFNSTTNISFETDQRTTVSLIVYNALGQQVRQLIKRTMPAGRHVTVWDGTDDAGQNVSSGVYMLKLVANSNQTFSKTMLLLK